MNDKILKLLKEKVSKNEYNNYIKQIKFNKSMSKIPVLVVFETPNIFIAYWMKTKYLKIIASIFEDLNGTIPTVQIVIKQNGETIKDINTDSVQGSTILNPSYTFNSFVLGESNEFAYTISKNIASKLGKLYNPLFLYGDTGLGKTHLMQSIGNYNIAKGKIVLYVTVEQFMNDFRQHIQKNTMEEFKVKYRSCDVLLIDDIQFISNKEKMQEEFFHTFNELHTNGKQIVLTCDKHPKDIKGLEARLRTRFEWGLVTDIQPPELDTKIKIIKTKCEIDDIELDDEIINYIAININTNIREIEGTLIKLNAFAKLMGQDITLDFTKGILKEQIKQETKIITLEDIVELVAREMNIKPSEIKSKKRNKDITQAKRIVIYLARILTSNSMLNISNYFIIKNHSTVSRYIRNLEDEMKVNEDLKLKVEEIKIKIKSR